MAALDHELRDFGVRVQASEPTMTRAQMLLQVITSRPEIEVGQLDQIFKSAKPDILYSALVYTGQLMARVQTQSESLEGDVCKRVISELFDGFS